MCIFSFIVEDRSHINFLHRLLYFSYFTKHIDIVTKYLDINFECIDDPYFFCMKTQLDKFSLSVKYENGGVAIPTR